MSLDKIEPMSPQAALTVIESGAERYPRGRLRALAQAGLEGTEGDSSLDEHVVECARALFSIGIIETGITSMKDGRRSWARVDQAAFNNLKLAIEAATGTDLMELPEGYEPPAD